MVPGLWQPEGALVRFICCDLFWAGLVHSVCEDAPHTMYWYNFRWSAVVLHDVLCQWTVKPYCLCPLWPQCWSVVMAPDLWCPCLQNKNPSMLCYMLGTLRIQRQSELPSKKCWAMESLLIPDRFGGTEYILALGFTACLYIVQKIGTYNLRLLPSSFLNGKVGKLPFG